MNCLKSIIEGCIHPRVIVTDREVALMKACGIVFPNAKQLLCRVHINRAILTKWKRTMHKSWSAFYKAWNLLMKSQTEETYMFNLTQLETSLIEHKGIVKLFYNY